VVAGLTLASSSSMAHDFYANVVKKGQTSEQQGRGREVRAVPAPPVPPGSGHLRLGGWPAIPVL